jgi:hypothetical protein
MNQKELIKHYSAELVKVISAHGAESDATVGAFYRLQAAKMGLPQAEMYKWALNKAEQLEEKTLAVL